MGAVTSTMAAKFAFFPPTPPSYELEEEESCGKLRMVAGIGVNNININNRENDDLLKLETKKGNQVVAVYFKNPAASLTVLYSHGNAADLGQMYELCSELCLHLRVNLMGCLEEKYGVKEEDVILYGQSVGSGPTLDLAARLPKLRAVVLHSPIASGLRVMYPVKRTYWFDIYKNINKIPLVSCPVLVIHGTTDDVVDWSHGKQLWERCKEKYEPLWVKGGNHCDLELYPQYIKHLKKFISAIEKSSRLRNISEPLVDQTEKPRTRTDFRETARSSIDRREKSRPNAEQKEQPRQITERREKSRSSTDRRERSRKSVDRLECNASEQPEKARNSIDRFGDMIRSVGLCNIECFKPTATAL